MNFAARAWLFDFDGTLVDSTPLHDWAFRTVLETAAPVILAYLFGGAVVAVALAVATITAVRGTSTGPKLGF